MHSRLCKLLLGLLAHDLTLSTAISHANLRLTKVNTYGLYYEWKGLDASLKPLLLAAHQGEPML